MGHLKDSINCDRSRSALLRFIWPRWAIVFKCELYETEMSENSIKLLFHSKRKCFYVKQLSISLHLPLRCVFLTFSVPSKTDTEYRIEIGNSGFATAQKMHLYVNTIYMWSNLCCGEGKLKLSFCTGGYHEYKCIQSRQTFFLKMQLWGNFCFHSLLHFVDGPWIHGRCHSLTFVLPLCCTSLLFITEQIVFHKLAV